MKKIAYLVLAVILAFSTAVLSSCNQNENTDSEIETLETLAGKTPEELYSISRSKLAIATEYSVVTNQVITISGAGDTMTVNQNIISKINGDNIYVKTSDDDFDVEALTLWMPPISAAACSLPHSFWNWVFR